jgi:ribonuclease-3 family protein
MIVNNNPIDENIVYQKSGQVLAFIGDAVQTLYVRAYYVNKYDYKTHRLHIEVSKNVNAVTQSKSIDLIIDNLKEREKEVYFRGRNAKMKSMSKKAEISEYLKATGLEAVLGYLYLSGQNERLDDILKQLII